MQFAQVDFERKDEDIEQNIDDAVKEKFKMFASEIDTAPEQKKNALQSPLGASAAVDIFRWLLIFIAPVACWIVNLIKFIPNFLQLYPLI